MVSIIEPLIQKPKSRQPYSFAMSCMFSWISEMWMLPTSPFISDRCKNCIQRPLIWNLATETDRNCSLISTMSNKSIQITYRSVSIFIQGLQLHTYSEYLINLPYMYQYDLTFNAHFCSFYQAFFLWAQKPTTSPLKSFLVLRSVE